MKFPTISRPWILDFGDQAAHEARNEQAAAEEGLVQKWMGFYAY